MLGVSKVGGVVVFQLNIWKNVSMMHLESCK